MGLESHNRTEWQYVESVPTYEDFKSHMEGRLTPESKAREESFIKNSEKVVDEIIKEAPDALIFLDKKGRILFLIIRDIIREKYPDFNMPPVFFLNSHNIANIKPIMNWSFGDSPRQIDGLRVAREVVAGHGGDISDRLSAIGIEYDEAQRIAKELMSAFQGEVSKDLPGLASIIKSNPQAKVFILDEIVGTGESLQHAKDIVGILGTNLSIRTGVPWAYDFPSDKKKFNPDFIGEVMSKSELPLPTKGTQNAPVFDFLGINEANKLEFIGIVDTPPEYKDEKNRSYNPERITSYENRDANMLPRNYFRRYIYDLVKKYF